MLRASAYTRALHRVREGVSELENERERVSE